jgi:hypothetical protein
MMSLGVVRIRIPDIDLDKASSPRCDEFSYRSGTCWQHIMTHYMLRDGTIRELSVHPDGLELALYTDLQQRTVHVLLSPASQATLLRAQPRQRPISLRLRQRFANVQAA